ncbi:MAG: winged helix-turn-helix domain-containing protein [Pseudomonadota bacterium]|nr:winged helix-turn-helix domain-containing protein [Pseudomonadota bacterium]
MALVSGELRIDPETGLATLRGAPLDVQPKVLELVRALLERRGALWTRAELDARLWPDVHVGEDALNQLLRKARRALGDDPDAPRFIETLHRRGWRWLPEVVEEARAPAGLVGRAALLASLSGKAAPGIRVLTGAPGIGKSAVARALVATRDHVWLDTSGLADLDDLVAEVARRLGVTLGAQSPEATCASVGRALSARGRLVLVLDGADRLAQARTGSLAAVLGSWVAIAPELDVCVTCCLEVDGLAAHPGVSTTAVPPLAEADAVALFQGWAEPRPGWGNGDLDVVRALVTALEGAPLALELAAALLELVPLAELARRIDERPATLAGRSGAVERSLGWARDLLPADARLVWALMSVFPGPFALAEAEGVVRLVRPDADVVAALELLAAARLVGGDPTRLHLSTAVRAQGAAELDGLGLRSLAISAWVGGVALRADGLLSGAWRWEVDALAALIADLPSLDLAWRRTLPDDPRRLVIGRALATALRYPGPWRRASDVLRAVTRERADPWARVQLAEYQVRLGEVDAALPVLTALAEGRAGDDTPADARAFAAFLLARVRGATGDRPVEAAALALALAARCHNAALQALAADQAGLAALGAGDSDTMRLRYTEALSLSTGASRAAVRAIVLQNYAACVGRLGLHAEAHDRLREALDVATALPFQVATPAVRANLGEALLQLRRLPEASACLDAALEDARRAGDLQAERHAISQLGPLRYALGATADALPLLARGAEVDPGAPPAHRARGALLTALSFAAEGKLDAAARWFAAAEATVPDGHPLRGQVLAWRALVAARAGNPEEATALLMRARAEPGGGGWIAATMG